MQGEGRNARHQWPRRFIYLPVYLSFCLSVCLFLERARVQIRSYTHNTYAVEALEAANAY